MKRHVLFTLIGMFALSALALADGLMMVDEATWKRNRERSMINEPEQKAVVFFSKGREQLIISPSYEGPSSNFAWIVPVPARPKVEIVEGAIFHELMKLTAPVPKRVKRAGEKALSVGSAPVQVLERKTVGAYDVSVLAATDGKALVRWLAVNKYHVPSKALGPIKSYVRSGWTFVACRVKVPSSAKGLHTGTLAPLKLSFAAKHPIYPMKLSSANPKPFGVLVYLLLPTSETGAKQKAVVVTGEPGRSEPGMCYCRATSARRQRRYPTLAKLSGEELQVYTYWTYPQPKQCTRDITWMPEVR